MMEIKWEVDDGYVGKSRPHFVEVDDDELAECDTEDERNEVIENAVQDDFEQTVSYFWEEA